MNPTDKPVISNVFHSRRWVMDTLLVCDSLPGDGADTRMTTWTYEKGFYDRVEREFLGFAMVTEKYHETSSNNTIKRTYTRYFRNDSIQTKGLMICEEIRNGRDSLYVVTANRYGSRTLNRDGNVSANARLSSRSNQLASRFQEDMQELLAEATSISSPVVMTVNSLNTTATATDIFYYHTNHLGSTAFVTDQNQNVTQGFLYAPFGEITTEYAPMWQNGTLPKYAFNAKELDEETGMYYYEARYYKPPVFTSRDPMFEKYFWMTPYAYCANNPVKYVDPDGNWPFWFDLKKRQSGWGHQAPQRLFGYSRFYDDNMNLLFDIQGVEFKMDGVTLRLWKGDYGKHRELLPNNISEYVGGAGGEIGLYNPNKSLRIGDNDFEASMTKTDLNKLGLIGTDLKVYNKQTGDLVASRSEESSFWTTSFSWDKKGKGEELYSVNTFTFKNTKYASKFFEGLKKNLQIAYNYEYNYEYNYNEPIKIRQKNNIVIITWGIGE